MPRDPLSASQRSTPLSRLRLWLLAAAAVPMLSGCAWLCSFCAGPGTTGPAPKQVAAVTLDAQSSPPRVVVFPEPIVYRLGDGPGNIEWRLSAGTGLRFPAE